jgi:flavin reductase (DIM6/NTAB) family NADH-FMN oxidoreductase RutF
VREDTAVNIHEMGEFIVNIGDVGHIEAIHQSSVEHPPEVSEAALLGLARMSPFPIRPIAQPYLRRLSETLGDTAFLTIVNGDDSVCIDR